MRSQALRAAAPDALLLGALLLLAVAAGLAPITNNDVWLHLATGRWMWTHGEVPHTEVFSFVAAGRPYVAHEWGSELILLAFHRLGGVAGLVVFKVLVALSLALALFAAGRSRGAPAAPAAGMAGLALFIAAAHLWARPHLLSWLALLAFIAILRRARQEARWLLALPLLQILWTNLHGGYILGPVVVLLWGLGEAVQERGLRRGDARPLRVLGTAGLCASATLVNPYGFELLRLPFELTASDVFMSAVFEWQPPWTPGYVKSAPLMAAVVLLGLLVAGRVRARRTARQSLDLAEIAVLLGLLALAVSMNRNVPLFALAAAPVAAGWLRPRGEPRHRWPAAMVAGVCLAVAAFIFAAGYPYTLENRRARGVGLGPATPEAACRYIESRGLTGNAFTTYGEGSYVVWRLWPDVRVGMDSRNSVYGEDLYLDYRAALRTDEGLRRYLQRWPVDLAVVTHQGPFRRGPDPVLDRDLDLPHRGFLQAGRLALVDFDDDVAVYADPDRFPQVRPDVYEALHPVLQPAAFAAADLPAAIEEGERAVRRHPGSVAARWLLAKAYAQSAREEEALAQLEALDGLGHRAARRWGVARAFEATRLGLAGLMHLRRGRCPEARSALERALQADPDNRPARDLLADLGC